MRAIMSCWHCKYRNEEPSLNPDFALRGTVSLECLTELPLHLAPDRALQAEGPISTRNKFTRFQGLSLNILIASLSKNVGFSSLHRPTSRSLDFCSFKQPFFLQYIDFPSHYFYHNFLHFSLFLVSNQGKFGKEMYLLFTLLSLKSIELS